MTYPPVYDGSINVNSINHRGGLVDVIKSSCEVIMDFSGKDFLSGQKDVMTIGYRLANPNDERDTKGYIIW